MKKIVLNSIKAYQKTGNTRKIISKALFPISSACRFQPTCSEYFYQAVEKYGVVKGLALGTKRILSCNPWGGKGYHPVP